MRLSQEAVSFLVGDFVDEIVGGEKGRLGGKRDSVTPCRKRKARRAGRLNPPGRSVVYAIHSRPRHSFALESSALALPHSHLAAKCS